VMGSFLNSGNDSSWPERLHSVTSDASKKGLFYARSAR
jgi:hypothetical protein